MKRTIIALGLFLTVACASTPLTSSSSSNADIATASTVPTFRNAPDYIVLSSPNQIRRWDFSNPGVKSFHIRGLATNAGFKAIGEVQGNGTFCTESTHWLSLSDVTVYANSEKRPTGSYIVGCAAGRGFQPSARTVVNE